jgi:hypothetical protein
VIVESSSIFFEDAWYSLCLTFDLILFWLSLLRVCLLVLFVDCGVSPIVENFIGFMGWLKF